MIIIIKSRIPATNSTTNKDILNGVNKEMGYIIVLSLLLVSSVVLLVIAGKHILKQDPI